MSVRYGVSNGLDMAYWGFLGVGTSFDIFQNIHILYLQYGMLTSSGYGVLSLFPLWSLVSAGTDKSDDFKVENLNSVICRIGYEDNDELLLYYKIPLKSLDLVEKTESSSDEDGQSDSESEDANDLVDEEHLVKEVEVNMNKFNFQLDGEDETDFIDPIQLHVNLTEDDLEVLDFDSLESDQEDVLENARSRGLRKLRKKHMSSGIRNNFYIGKEFANKDLAKERIRAYAVETRRNLDFKVNDKRRIRVICNGVVPTLNSKNEYVDKIQGPNQDIFEKGKGIMQDAKEYKMSYPWLLYLSKGDKSKWAKAKEQVHLRGDVEIQYSLLRDYANELQRCNPDTTVKIDVYGEEDHEKPTRMFRRIYVCLGALKRGFKESGRELLGLDGAFMRGQYYGQMLTAVGVDANNGIYPVAYDRQKVLVPTIAKLFPAAEHRWLLDARDNQIINSLEYVREYLMKRIIIIQKIIQKSDGPLTPTVTKLFIKIKKAAFECSVDWNGSDLFQVKGIPCKHVIVVIHDMTDNDMDVGTLEDWVHESVKPGGVRVQDVLKEYNGPP
ncbi:hypothetical protein Tco_1214412 [Tanacetum coccineum]